MLHSLDRVSRRVNENHFLRIRSETEGTARPTRRPAGGALRAVRRPGRPVPRHPRREAFAGWLWLRPRSTRRHTRRPITLTGASYLAAAVLPPGQTMRRLARGPKCNGTAACSRAAPFDSAQPGTLISIASPYPISDPI